MKTRFPYLVVMLFALLACQLEEEQALSTPEPPEKQAYIAVFKPTAEGRAAAGPDSEWTRSLQEKLRAYDISAVPDAVYHQLFTGVQLTLSAAEHMRLRKMPELLALEAEREIDALLPLPEPKTNLRTNDEQWGLHRLNGPADGTGKTAWIIDSGVDMDHPDLIVDEERSKSFLPWYYYEWSADDLRGHGTHIAGVIGAKNDSIGTTGVAAGATIVSVKVLNRNCRGSLFYILDGLEYVAENVAPGEVVNISFGGKTSVLLDWAVEAIAEKGAYVVMAAGNRNGNAENYSPTRTNGENIFTVSAMEQGDLFADFSNFGSPVDFCAPGVNILSTYKNGTYETMSGTSMAAPFVAGLLLVKDKVDIIADETVRKDPDGYSDPIFRIQ